MQEFYAVFDSVLTSAAPRDALRAHVAHRATVPAVRELLESGGFEVVRVVERTAKMRFASGSDFIKLGFLDAWKKVVEGSEEEIFPRLQEALDRQGELSLTIPMAYIEANA